jgi:hypothetical protein
VKAGGAQPSGFDKFHDDFFGGSENQLIDRTHLQHLFVRSFYNKIDSLAEKTFDVKILSNRLAPGIQKIMRVYLTPNVFLIIKRVDNTGPLKIFSIFSIKL